MLIKLLERDDIRRYSKNVVEVADHIGFKLIELKRAILVSTTLTQKKSIMSPPLNKAVWSPPEEKSMMMTKSSVIEQGDKNPGKNDPLFPKSIIS